MTMSAIALRHHVQQTNTLAARMSGKQEVTAARKLEVTSSVASAKAREGLTKEIKRAFEALQKSAHERSVGTFERLLTALLNDVLPKEGKVRFLPKYRDNTTWLDVALEKNGNLEDILEGNGGAVTNVVSAGLRYASLTRTKNRRFMVLDEPDCWLKADRIPAFIRVIAQVAKMTKVQTLFISHFGDLSLHPGLVNVVELSADADGRRHAKVVGPIVEDWENDTVPGIRGIELINFRAHVHTVIPFFPGATAFVGGNNLGKSAAISGSMKAVAYGESDDSVIHHDASSATVIFHLEEKKRLEWTRSRKGSPAVMYRLFQGDALLHESRQPGRNQAPEWCEKLLGIVKVDDLDIQVGNQKTPVFLLDETAATRAQILSLGRESSHLKTLMRDYEQVKSTDAETIKLGELELGRINFNLSKLEPIPEISLKVAQLVSNVDDVCNLISRQDRIESLLARLELSHKNIALIDAELTILLDVPEMPVLRDMSAHLNLACKLEGHAATLAAMVIPVVPSLPEMVDLEAMPTLSYKLERGRNLLDAMQFPNLPVIEELVDTERLKAFGVQLVSSQKILTALEALPNVLPELPQLDDLSKLGRIVSELTTASARVAAANEELAPAVLQEASAQAELEVVTKLKAEIRICPLCDSCLSPIDGEAHVH